MIRLYCWPKSTDCLFSGTNFIVSWSGDADVKAWEMNIADYDAELWQAMGSGKSTSGRAHRTDRLRKLHQPARDAGGVSADSKYAEGYPGSATTAVANALMS